MTESGIHWSENTVGADRLVRSVRGYIYAFWRVPGGCWAIPNVWSAAVSQAKCESDRLVCKMSPANQNKFCELVMVAYWSRTRTRFFCGQLSRFECDR